MLEINKEYPLINPDTGDLVGCFTDNGNRQLTLQCSGCAMTKTSSYVCGLLGRKWIPEQKDNVDYDKPQAKVPPETGEG